MHLPLSDSHRALWLTLERPGTDGGGGARRQAFLVEALRRHGPVDVLVSDPHSELPRALMTRLLARAAPGGTAPWFSDSPFSLRAAAHARANDATTVVVAHVETAAVLAGLLSDASLRVIVDFQNVHSRYELALGHRVRATSWRRLERLVCTAADAVTVVSEEEASPLRAYGTPVLIVPNGVDPSEWPEHTSTLPREGLAYFGSWSHTPNTIGLGWFLSSVWPRVRTAVPAANLHLYGQGRPPVANAPGVIVHGRAPDLSAALARHQGSIVPIVTGMGSRTKFIESLAAGLPVVTTSLGVQGFSIPPGLCLVRDEASDFAEACRLVLSDDDAMAPMAAAARAHALQHHSWHRSAQPLVDLLAASETSS
jgi:glycosyltransferase involved in cell wall biosynthesis